MDSDMRLTTVLIFLAISTMASATDTGLLRLNYQGLDFYIPKNPVTIGFLGTESDLLLVKYSQEPGEKYIGFGIESKDFNTGGCNPEEFLDTVLGESNDGCNKEDVESFRMVFVENRDAGVWASSDARFYYFLSDKKSTVFHVLDNQKRRSLMIESDFISKKEIRKALSDFL
jgi:hypothetical protein